MFRAIGDIASAAEQGLAEFIAAQSPEEKLQIYDRVEQSRADWLQSMERMQTELQDGAASQGPTEAPSERDGEVEEFHDAIEDTFDKTWEAMLSMGAFQGNSSVYSGARAGTLPRNATSAATSSAAAAGSGAAVAKPTPSTTKPVATVPAPPLVGEANEVRGHMVKYLQDGAGGFLPILRKAVEDVQRDARFEGVHEDAIHFLEQMELSAGAILALAAPAAGTQQGSIEEREHQTLEASRNAQSGANEAKKLAFTIQKFDIYIRKKEQPRLSDEHPALTQCAQIAVELANYFRKEAQAAVMESMTRLVAHTNSP